MTAAEASDTPLILVEYDPVLVTGKLTLVGTPTSAVWERFRARVLADQDGRDLSSNSLELPWSSVLGLLHEYGSKHQQKALNFRFRLEGQAAELAKEFARDVQRARAARGNVGVTLSPSEVLVRLAGKGFTKRSLLPFQIRDLVHLLALPHGANFSVPGAGKTTVTFALHLLAAQEGQHLFVVGPKSSFPAWTSIVDECIDGEAPTAEAARFVVLDGSQSTNEALLRSGATRFLMSYDLMVRQQAMLAPYFARQPVHLVLDEAHRMKAGVDSQRGAFLLRIAPLVARRDILTGTPMPQGAEDVASQLAFLWPGQGLDSQLRRGMSPRSVLGDLYVRTTKTELGLPRVSRHFHDVAMLPGQQALYAIIRNETLRSLSKAVRAGRASVDFLGARRSVMRLLQLSSNPILALRGITKGVVGINSGVVDAVLDEGPSSKMRAVIAHTRQLTSEGRKVVIWTIFTDTITELETLLAELNPVTLYGAVASGDVNDPATREARLRRFHEDDSCLALIANPAASGEGISLHTACHDAIYLDRSYVSTHYLQSVDRIHRLGLAPGVETNIHIYRTKAPAGIGSIDYSVSRRLAKKIRALQELLDDVDLHEIAFDEENADDPIDYSVDMQDLVDLVSELEGAHRIGDDEEFE